MKLGVTSDSFGEGPQTIDGSTENRVQNLIIGS